MFLIILDALLWETTLAGIPGSILGQIAFVNSLGGWWWARLIAAALAVSVALLAIGPTRLAEWYGKLSALRAQPVPQPAARQPIDEDLKQRCCELSAEIFEFYRRQREHKEEALQSDYMRSLYNDPARDQIRSEQAAGHDSFMVDRYGEQFGGRVSALCDDLEPHGWCTPEDRRRFENAGGPEDVRYTAQRLDAICGRFNES